MKRQYEEPRMKLAWLDEEPMTIGLSGHEDGDDGNLNIGDLEPEE